MTRAALVVVGIALLGIISMAQVIPSPPFIGLGNTQTWTGRQTFALLGCQSTGTAAVCGTATLVAGTVTVSTTAVNAGSIIYIARRTNGGTLGGESVGTVTPGVSFVINSTSGTDTSAINWIIFN